MEEADMAQRKSFIKSLVKGIEVYGEKVIVRNKLPLPDDGRGLTETSVLLIETFGGPLGTVPELLFEKKGLIPAIQQLLVVANSTS